MKKFLLIMLAVSILFSASALAEETTISVMLEGGVKVYINGALTSFTDAYGQPVEPMIYNGRVYLPLNCVAEVLDMSYSWDGSTMSAYLGAQAGDAQLLHDVCPPYQKSDVRFYSTKDGSSFNMAGTSYTNGMRLRCVGISYVMYNLNGKYESLSFTIGHVDGTDMEDGIIRIFLDGELAEELHLSCEALPQEITVPLNRALSMKISYSNKSTGYGDINGFFNYGLANITVE